MKALFDCGCSHLKVSAGRCDVYGPDGEPRVADTIPAPPPVVESLAGKSDAGGKRKQGFAVMPRGLVVELASKGGKAAHAKGRAHVFTSEEARAAGRIGGRVSRRRGRQKTLFGGGEGAGA